jgi:hypothetical protein
VERLPADWFPRETYGLLAQSVRHVTTARRLARLPDVRHHREADHLGRAVEAAEGIAHRRRLWIAPSGLKPICFDNALLILTVDHISGTSAKRLSAGPTPKRLRRSSTQAGRSEGPCPLRAAMRRRICI